MAAEKAPAFQFYAKEFLTDGNVAGMSLPELGAYIKLMALCWQEQRLPMDAGRLANMVGVSRAAWLKLAPAVLRCFGEVDGWWRHPRLDKERAKQAANREVSSERGVKGAAARWSKHAPSIAQAMPTTMLGDGSPISDLQTPSKNPPNPPTGGRSGKPTRSERQTAERLIRHAFGCTHDPKCTSHDACVLLVVQGLRERAS